MQFSFQTIMALAAMPVVRLALAQADPGPSPTASLGCAPHDDHWHCEGANPTVAPISTTTQAAAPITVSASTSTVTITTTTSAISSSSAAAEHDHDDHDHEEDEHTDALGSGTIAPSPTASIGCEPHGDHWHCDGPRTVLTSVAPIRTISNTTAAPTGASTSPTSSTQSLLPTGGAATIGAGVIGGLLGLVGAFAL